MAAQVDLFDSTYGHFEERVLEAVRRATFIDDIGQNGWLTSYEHDRFIDWLDLMPGQHVLEVASGSGGPAIRLARQAHCRVTGIDVNPSGIATAARRVARCGLEGRVDFVLADATAPLPFESGAFDGLMCIDSMNHFADRAQVFRDWHRVLRSGGHAVFTDPVVVTGPVTNHELALRSSIGLFLFVPAGVNERLIAEAGFRLRERVDVTDNAAAVSGRWQAARRRYEQELLQIEGEFRYHGLQEFFGAVHRLTSERRLSRFAYLVEKVGD